MSGKGYPPGATTVARTHILSECLNRAHEFKQAKKRHRPAPMPLMRTHILSYKPHTSTKAWLQPYARKTHGGRSHAFLFGSDFEKKESGPNISARPAYIRGANDRIRTGDLRFTRALLYQLSHVGTRLLAKREYELYRRACRFARGKCNFSGERAGIRRFSTGLHPCLYDPREPHKHALNRCGHHT